MLFSFALLSQPTGGGDVGLSRGEGRGRDSQRQGSEEGASERKGRAQQAEEIDTTPKIGTVVGKVFDQKDESPIEYASVVLINSETKKNVTGTITNDKGGFTIKNVPGGDFILEVSFIGYSKATKKDITISHKNKRIDVSSMFLKESADMLDEVTVVGEVATIENRIDKRVINVGGDLLAPGSSALELFQNVPMVEVDLDNNVSLRGSDNVRVLVDNRPSNMTVVDLLATMPAEAILRIELITNPSAKEDPDGL